MKITKALLQKYILTETQKFKERLAKKVNQSHWQNEWIIFD
jgi:hypothetical protein